MAQLKQQAEATADEDSATSASTLRPPKGLADFEADESILRLLVEELDLGPGNNPMPANAPPPDVQEARSDAVGNEEPPAVIPAADSPIDKSPINNSSSSSNSSDEAGGGLGSTQDPLAAEADGPSAQAADASGMAASASAEVQAAGSGLEQQPLASAVNAGAAGPAPAAAQTDASITGNAADEHLMSLLQQQQQVLLQAAALMEGSPAQRPRRPPLQHG